MRKHDLIVACAAFFFLVLPPALAEAATVPTLALNPTSGNPPLVSGSLNGSGWLCSSAVPAGTATVSGSGVVGTASFNRDGSLTGSFTVRGTAGQSAATIPPTPTTTSITALQPKSTTAESTLAPTATVEPVATVAPTPEAVAATAIVPAPTATRAATATLLPVSTVEPTATPPPTPTSGIKPPAATSSQGSLLFVGCIPSPSQVRVEFLPLGLSAESGADEAKASGPAITVQAVPAPDDPRKFIFQPPAAEAGRIFQVSADVQDPQCSLAPESSKSYWLAGAGKSIQMPVLYPGITTLEMSNNGDQPPVPVPQIKGAFFEVGSSPQYSAVDPADQLSGWETELTLYGSELKDRKQRFRWSTDLATPSSGMLQVGWLPFPKGYEENPLSPPGLLASWPVDCVNCEFIADLSSLPAPEPEKSLAPESKEKSWLERLGDLIAASFKAMSSAFVEATRAVAGLFDSSNQGQVRPR